MCLPRGLLGARRSGGRDRPAIGRGRAAVARRPAVACRTDAGRQTAAGRTPPVVGASAGPPPVPPHSPPYMYACRCFPQHGTTAASGDAASGAVDMTITPNGQQRSVGGMLSTRGANVGRGAVAAGGGSAAPGCPPACQRSGSVTATVAAKTRARAPASIRCMRFSRVRDAKRGPVGRVRPGSGRKALPAGSFRARWVRVSRGRATRRGGWPSGRGRASEHEGQVHKPHSSRREGADRRGSRMPLARGVRHFRRQACLRRLGLPLRDDRPADQIGHVRIHGHVPLLPAGALLGAGLSSTVGQRRATGIRQVPRCAPPDLSTSVAGPFTSGRRAVAHHGLQPGRARARLGS